MLQNDLIWRPLGRVHQVTFWCLLASGRQVVPKMPPLGAQRREKTTPGPKKDTKLLPQGAHRGETTMHFVYQFSCFEPKRAKMVLWGAPRRPKALRRPCRDGFCTLKIIKLDPKRCQNRVVFDVIFGNVLSKAQSAFHIVITI